MSTKGGTKEKMFPSMDMILKAILVMNNRYVMSYIDVGTIEFSVSDCELLCQLPYG